MVSFCCDNCGKCCVSLGSYITVERQLSERDYYCKNGITGELFLVHVQGDASGEIDDDFALSGPGVSGLRKSCVFLRKNPLGSGQICAIYPTRPKICQDFRCYHAVILNPADEIVGRMVGKSDINTSDPKLTIIWKDKIKPCFQPVNHSPGEKREGFSPEDSMWIEKVSSILEPFRYRIEKAS